MTWRYLSPRTLQRMQWFTLGATALLGLSIAWTPRDRNIATLSVIESAMSSDIWAIALVTLSLIALIAELDMAWRKHERWINLVTYMHLLLCAVLVSYSVSALWGVLFRVWWNFGAPTLGALLAYYHYSFMGRWRRNAKR